MLFGSSRSSHDQDGCTPLCHACAAEGGQAHWVSQLLGAGASLNPPRPHGKGPTARGWNARAWGAAAAVVGAEVDPVATDGFTNARATSAALGAVAGRVAGAAAGASLVPALVPGSVKAQAWGGSPLEEAASRGHAKVVAVLCAAAAAVAPAAAQPAHARDGGGAGGHGEGLAAAAAAFAGPQLRSPPRSLRAPQSCTRRSFFSAGSGRRRAPACTRAKARARRVTVVR